MNGMQALADWKQNLYSQAHPSTKGATAAQPAAKLADSASSAGSSSGSTTITANDFLQLLVAEMKNQDPTATQDPNAYIDQLVQVNSLQQLIAINQDLTPTGSASSGAIRASGFHGRLGGQLGTAAGSAAASVATSLAPKPAKPETSSESGFDAVQEKYAKRNSSLNTAVLPPPASAAMRTAPTPGR